MCDIDAAVIKMVQPGNKLHAACTSPEKERRLLHMLAIVDDEMVVFKEWFKRKQMWCYAVRHLLYFQHMYSRGELTDA